MKRTPNVSPDLKTTINLHYTFTKLYSTYLLTSLADEWQMNMFMCDSGELKPTSDNAR